MQDVKLKDALLPYAGHGSLSRAAHSSFNVSLAVYINHPKVLDKAQVAASRKISGFEKESGANIRSNTLHKPIPAPM